MKTRCIFPTVKKDLQQLGMTFQAFNDEEEYADMDFFFLQMRLRIKYEVTQGYTRLKLRTLLKHYGYKRRSKKVMYHISACINHYQLLPTQKGMVCNIWDNTLDDMITFRINDDIAQNQGGINYT